MSLYIIRKGRGVPANGDCNWPEGQSRDIRLPVGRGVANDGLNLRIAMPAVFEGDFSFSGDERNLLIFGVCREPIGEVSSKFFTELRTFANSLPAGDLCDGLEKSLGSRDAITADLARADSSVKTLLRELFC